MGSETAFALGVSAVAVPGEKGDRSWHELSPEPGTGPKPELGVDDLQRWRRRGKSGTPRSGTAAHLACSESFASMMALRRGQVASGMYRLSMMAVGKQKEIQVVYSGFSKNFILLL